MSGTPTRLVFHHGLGDVLMFRNVLQVLPSPVELFLHPALGQHAIFAGDPGVRLREPSAGEPWATVRFEMERSRACAGGAPTKARICLEHEFGQVRPDVRIRPLPLEHLEVVNTDATRATACFLRGFERYAVCHFQGTWNPDGQNPEPAFAERTIASLLDRGYRVVLINYDYLFHNPRNADLAVVDGEQVRSTFRRLPLAFESLWLLLRHASLVVAVDSGPLHAAVCLDVGAVYLRRSTNFATDFYDEGLDRLVEVDTFRSVSVPTDAIAAAEGVERGAAPCMTRTSRDQADVLRRMYAAFQEEMIEAGRLHDAGRLGRRGLVYRTDAEALYAAIRSQQPDLVIDLCTGAGDALSYILLALERNDRGRVVSVDRGDRQDVREWLRACGLPDHRLQLFDRTDMFDAMPSIAAMARASDRLAWALDTDHEFSTGLWELEHVIKPFEDRSIFWKDDIVCVGHALESDMGALYAIRDYITARHDVVSTNAAFGAVSGLPCANAPYRGAETRATPGAIPFRPVQRNAETIRQIHAIYPRWDPDANKAILFGRPDVARFDAW